MKHFSSYLKFRITIIMTLKKLISNGFKYECFSIVLALSSKQHLIFAIIGLLEYKPGYHFFKNSIYLIFAHNLKKKCYLQNV